LNKLGNWLLSLGSIAVFSLALLAAEGVLRLVDPGYFYELNAEESSNVYSEVYGWELRRGFHGLDFGKLATVNGRGYRGPERPYERTAGRTRVVVLGDSIAYSAGVDEDHAFYSLVEARRPDLEIVNLAVGGYGTDQELIRLEREGLRYHPDAVVLHFCLFSDYTDNSLPSALFDARQPKPYYTWDGQALTLHAEHLKLSRLRAIAQWLSDYSHLFNRVRGLFGWRRPPRQPGVWSERKGAVERDLGPAAELTFALIRRMAELSRKAGARFYVVIHPDQFAFEHRSHLLRKLCTAPMLEGIPMVEMGERHRAAGMTFEQLALDGPGHLTQRGHVVLAEVMERLATGTMPADWEYRGHCAAQFAPAPRAGGRLGASLTP
jgi:hypothetical protein